MKKRHLQSKLIIGLVMIGIVLMLAMSLAVTNMFRVQMEHQYSRTAFDNATIAAAIINGDTIKRYRETLQKDEYYEEIREKLESIRSTVGLKYLYVVIPEDVQFYIWDTGEEGDEGVCDLGDTDEFYGDGYEVMHSAFSPDAEETILITDNAVYGYLASAYVPILDSDGVPAALASVDISLDEINKQIDRFVLVAALVTFAVLLLSSVGYYFYIRNILINPIRTLHDDTKKLVSDNMDTLDKFENHVHTGDELEELGTSFEFMTRELNDYIRNLASVTAEKERIGAELNVATQIQADMLPRIFPAFPERSEFDIYATMTPAKEVGGDFYDFFLVDDDHIALVMADVSGKGVPAALFMVIAKTLIKNHALAGESPSQILSNVNDQLCEGNEAELFVTVWLAIVQLSTGKGIAANAGHEHPALRRADGSYELVVYRHSPAVAAMEGMRFKEHEFELHPGDGLFVYTDGVTEATNSELKLFGTDNMLDALNRDPMAAPGVLLKNVRDGIDTFVGDMDQFDDITMLGFSYFGLKKEAPEELTLDAVDDNLDKVLGFINERLDRLGCDPKIRKHLDVSVEELFVNISHYAYKPDTGKATIRFEYNADSDTAFITLIDSGIPYDPLKKPDPDLTLSVEERPIGGLGIFMTKHYVDNIRYERDGGKNILTLEKKLKS